MRGKKFLCLLLTGALTIGAMMTVSATDDAVEDKSVSSGNVTVSGNGDVQYLDTNIYNVQLPTSTALGKVVVDPLGLYKFEGEAVSLDELDTKAGKIFTTSKPRITNMSSVPMLVTTTFTLDTDADVLTADDQSKVHQDVSGSDPAPNQLLMYAVPSAVDVENDSGKYQSASKGIVLKNGNDNSVEAEFVLEAAKYVVDVSDGNLRYVLKTGEAGHGTAISFEGLVNKYADWSAYAGADATESIELSVVFAFDSNVGDKKVAEDSVAYGMVDLPDETDTIDIKSDVLVSDGTKDIVIYYTGDKPDSITITPDAISGTNKAAFTMSPSSNLTIGDDKCIIAASYVATLISKTDRGSGTYIVAVGSKTVTITIG